MKRGCEFLGIGQASSELQTACVGGVQHRVCSPLTWQFWYSMQLGLQSAHVWDPAGGYEVQSEESDVALVSVHNRLALRCLGMNNAPAGLPVLVCSRLLRRMFVLIGP